MTDRPLAILHVYNQLNPLNGGPPRVIRGLAAGQRAQGHTVRFASADAEGDPGVAEFYGEQLDPLPERVVVGPRAGSLWRLGRWIARSDVVHLHGIWPVPDVVAADLCRLLRVPYVLSPHGSLHPGALDEKSLKKQVGRHLLGFGRMVKHAAALHCLNPDEQAGVSWPHRGRPVVIPNGVFPGEFENLPDPKVFRDTVPALGDAPYVLFLSRLHPGKGCAELGQAFALLAAARPDLHLVAAGPDQGGVALLKAGAGAFADRVHTVGVLSGAPKLAALAGAAVYCLPSHHEGFSMAITEALACGRPVVITRQCHFPQVSEVGAGLEVALDPAAIAAGLAQVLDAPDREAMGQRGRALVLERYTWPKIAAEMVALYREVCAR
ncbi:MAG: glycosyltransferase [Myxococcales bacterium]|nr:glycosyltransferase [Myxococcales bacterium]